MPVLTHTVRCEEQRESRGRRRARWKARWPNHCRVCEGSTDAGHPCLGRRGDGDRYGWRPDQPGCLYHLTCPRCGGEDAMHPEDANVPCRFCQYHEGQAEYDGEANPNYMGCLPERECACRAEKAQTRERKRATLRRERARLEEQLRALG